MFCGRWSERIACLFLFGFRKSSTSVLPVFLAKPLFFIHFMPIHLLNFANRNFKHKYL